jgi:hypothetical protein
MLLTLAATLFFQVTPSPPAPRDTIRIVPRDTIHIRALADTVPAPIIPDSLAVAFDSPATEALVARVIRESGEIPAGLEDYQADVNSMMTLALAPDTSLGGELPVTIDEMAGEVRWNRTGQLFQWINGHRTQLRVPAPYTLGTLLEQPWIVPHLYGPSISVLSLALDEREQKEGSPQAIHPFGPAGPRYYRYVASDTLRVLVEGERVTLVGIDVAPRVTTRRGGAPLVVGSFYVDTTRAAVARARFGFVTGNRALPLARTGTFLELENGLWQGRYWLPYRQRREIQVSSALLGGAVAGRITSVVTGYRLNTGWVAPANVRLRLIRSAEPEKEAFADWHASTAPDAEAFDIRDFIDLRQQATAAANPATGGVRIVPAIERSDHLFRYNRVEGAFLGVGARLEPADPLRRAWDVYATSGWAFAEQTPRGEVRARWRAAEPLPFAGGARWGVEADAYRRLQEVRAFQPTFRWDVLYTFPALFGGSDTRDYYDALGGALAVTTRGSEITGRLGARVERQDSVVRNTTKYLFGTAEDFPLLAPVDVGTHAALEGEIATGRGAGVWGVGNSAVAALRGEVGVGDFRFQRAIGLLSLRRSLGIVTLATRLDAGAAWGAVPVQKLFRFGSGEGLRGFETNEVAGSTAALARARLLIGLPPYSTQPLARSGFLFLPPLRPNLVLLGEAGWTEISEQARPALERLGSKTTDGVRGSAGVGVSFFEDFVSIEWVRPLEGGRKGTWRVGLVEWF